MCDANGSSLLYVCFRAYSASTSLNSQQFRRCLKRMWQMAPATKQKSRIFHQSKNRWTKSTNWCICIKHTHILFFCSEHAIFLRNFGDWNSSCQSTTQRELPDIYVEMQNWFGSNCVCVCLFICRVYTPHWKLHDPQLYGIDAVEANGNNAPCSVLDDDGEQNQRWK